MEGWTDGSESSIGGPRKLRTMAGRRLRAILLLTLPLAVSALSVGGVGDRGGVDDRGSVGDRGSSRRRALRVLHEACADEAAEFASIDTAEDAVAMCADALQTCFAGKTDDECRSYAAKAAPELDQAKTELNSALGRHDGRVYEALMASAEKEPLNTERPRGGWQQRATAAAAAAAAAADGARSRL